MNQQHNKDRDWRDTFTELWYSLGKGEIEKMDDFVAAEKEKSFHEGYEKRSKEVDEALRPILNNAKRANNILESARNPQSK